MPSQGTVLVDGSFGDTGKGRVVDFLVKDFDIVCKYNGSANSGRCVISDGKKFIFRHIPSGILHPHVQCLMGQGMVIDALVLADELKTFDENGISYKDRLFVSDSAHIVMPYHIMCDKAKESGPNKIGTTKRGVGPCYEDKVARRSIRVSDLSNSNIETVIKNNVYYWLKNIKGYVDGNEFHSILNENISYAKKAKEILMPFIADVPKLINDSFKADKKVLFEGAQGTFLDIDHGTYPYVTSSSCIAGGACTGAGVGPTKINRVIGVSKAYTTRVGDGPFAAELSGDNESLAQLLRTKGCEFGSVTGRPRRVGWLDLDELKRACMLNGVTDLVITKSDVMSHLGLDKFFVRLNSKLVEVAAWNEDLSKMRKFDELPENFKQYIKLIETETEVPVSMISVGPERDSNIVINEAV